MDNNFNINANEVVDQQPKFNALDSVLGRKMENDKEDSEMDLID